LKNLIRLLLILLLLITCSRPVTDIDSSPDSLFPEAPCYPLKTEEKYETNLLTGKPVKPLINQQGDTVKTGIQVSLKGKLINPDSIKDPIKQKIPPASRLISKKAQQQLIQSGTNFRTVLYDSTKQKRFIPGNIASSFVLINHTGDTLKTGIPVPVEGRTTPLVQPEIIPALDPGIKDNARFDMQYLDIDQGLASSYVWCIIEDHRGNLWFGTNSGGVNCYDGEFFTYFTTMEGLSDNDVYALLEDRDGNIWIGTNEGGVCMFDGASFTHFTEEEGLSNNNVYSIFEDRSGNIWIGTNGGGVVCYDGNTFTRYTTREGLCDNCIVSIFEDQAGNLWFGTNKGACSFNGKYFKHFTEAEGLTDEAIWSIIDDNNGRLWFATNTSGIVSFDGKSFSHYSDFEGSGGDVFLSSHKDKDGLLWFGTESGTLLSFDGTSFSQYAEKEGMGGHSVWAIVSDPGGNLWLGTSSGGAVCYDSRSFAHYTADDGLNSDVVYTIHEDSRGNLWYGTNSGVCRYDGDQYTYFTLNEGLGSNEVFSIMEDSRGDLWFGTRGGGVNRFDGRYITNYTLTEGMSENVIYTSLEDQHGVLWFGTNGGGLTSLSGDTIRHFTQNEGLSSNDVVTILEDSKGNLWFGTWGGGVNLYDGDQLTIYSEAEGLSSNYISSLLEDRFGNIWIGTAGNGINCIHEQSIIYLTTREGLSNNKVWTLLEDRNGNIWTSTEQGLNYIVLKGHKYINQAECSRSLNYTIHNFGKGDGLIGLDFFVNSVYADSKNRIWWGSGKSLVMLDMNKFRISGDVPIPSLRQLDINEQFLDYRNLQDSLKRDIRFSHIQPFENYPLDLDLPYYHNHLTFHFSATNWSNPHKTRYSYRMLGLNQSWSQPDRETKADFRNLGFGSYTFQIRALSERGLWSDPFEYDFTIHPPWWHTWLARAGYILILIIAVYAYVRWRTAKLKQRQKELEEEVRKATLEIRNQKELIETKQEEILDSINYAKRIQGAILPPSKLVKKLLPRSFILYLPKDIVAGDFYWLETSKDLIFFAAADCTGHGVPGAMVSVICNSGLNKCVREYGILEPGRILDKTREIVIEEFEKSEEDVKDGMDISLCVFNPKSLELQWAGANNPLWIIRDKDLLEYKADRQPIGKYEDPKSFVNHTIQLKKNDMLYLFSDGFRDQFGGVEGKKFKAGNFKKLILSVQEESMEKQGKLLEKSFLDWKGELEQLDDVCVLGVWV